MKRFLALFVCLLSLAGFMVNLSGAQPTTGESYIADLPVVNHPETFKWDFAPGISGPAGSDASGLVPINEAYLKDLSVLEHPYLFKWDFEGEAGPSSASDGSDMPLNPAYLKDLHVFEHPYLFKWRFGGRAVPEPVVETPAPPVEEPTVIEEEPGPPVRDDEPVEWIALPVRTVYFDYDRSELKPKAREAIQTNVEFLKQNPEAKVLVEGHCDERGTQEYNLALGERRAKAIQGYMQELGIDGSRISIKSWGEELPVALGHDEAAWSQNRRGEMYYSKLTKTE